MKPYRWTQKPLAYMSWLIKYFADVMLPLKPHMCDAHEFADSEIGIGGPAALVCVVLLCFAVMWLALLA